MILHLSRKFTCCSHILKMSAGISSFPCPVFVYGTLKTNEPNHAVLTDGKNGTATFVATARTVKKWPLIIASSYNIPYLLYIEGKGHHVYGELYNVNEKMLETLDKLECHPDYYERTMEEVEILGKESTITTAAIYFLKKYKPVLMEKPYLETYSSEGDHGLQYVPSEDTSSVDDIED
ncbi:gamma-glutamylaminecyclotransferase C-like isoform X2 [Ornithodoros turicata]|uniref:gamma-glutamylaminecyclotransferase C-like isoform X2 n=1 Tax=Ornithodoros turicata TaxID=34597 RepID=UPI0031394043